MSATQTQIPEITSKRRNYAVLLGGLTIATLLLTLLANLLYGAIKNAADRANLDEISPSTTLDSGQQ